MQVSNVVDRSFELVRREWRAAVVIGGLMVGWFVAGFVFVAALFLTAGGIEAFVEDSVNFSALPGTAFFVTFATWMVVALVAGVCIYIANGVATRAALHGDGTSWSGLVPHIRPAAWAGLRLLGWSLLVSLAIGAVFVLIGIAVVALTGFGETPAIAIVAAVLISLAVLVVSIGLVPYVFVTLALVYGDELGVLAAFGESRRLIRGRYWPSLGASLILYLFSFIPVLGSLAVSLLQPFYMAALVQELRATR